MLPSPTTPIPADTGRRRGHVFRVALPAVACLLAGVLYLGALDNPFIYDDYRLVVENRSLHDLTNLRALFWQDATRPVVNLSLAVDRALWGPSPVGFHVTNVLLHMANVLLLAWWARAVAGDAANRGRSDARSNPDIVAAAAALLFAVHPMMTQAVGYISGRSELLCGTLLLGALLLARRWIRNPRPTTFAAVVACWLLALASREVAVMFPLVLLAFDRWAAGRGGATWRERVRWLHLPLFGLAAVLGIARLLVFVFSEHGGAVAIDWSLVPVELDVVRRYVALLLSPGGQTIFHFVPPIDGWTDRRLWFGLATVALLAGTAWAVRRREALVGLGLTWFLLLLVPSAILVILGRGEPMAEHRVYLASVGFFLAVGVGAARTWVLVEPQSRMVHHLAMLAAAVSLIGFAGRTLERNALWDDPQRVWLEAAARAPGHWLPLLGLGEQLHRAGDHAQAAVMLRRVTIQAPAEQAAYGKLGVCLSETGDLAGAAEAFSTLQTLVPRSTEASNGLATVKLLEGAIGEARQGYLGTLELDPLNVAARRGLLAAAELGKDADEALRWCEELRQLLPATSGDDACNSGSDNRTTADRPR